MVKSELVVQLGVEHLEDSKNFQIINDLENFRRGWKKFVYKPLY